MMVMVELLDFVEQGQAEGLLAMEVDERIKKHSYSDTEKVARIDNMNENSYLRKEEWKVAMEHYDREGHQVAVGSEPGLANREEK